MANQRRSISKDVFEQIQKDGAIPSLDICTIKHIRWGYIKIYQNIDHISGKTVHFTDGRQEDFDAIVAAIGYYRHYSEIIDVDKNRFDDLKFSVGKQKYFGKDGLYFCGFWVSPSGQLREIALDANRMAIHIAEKRPF